MSQHEQDDFPPHWDPPPRIAYGDDPKRLIEVLESVCQSPQADWVRAIYVTKLRQCLRTDVSRAFGWDEMSQDLVRISNILSAIPEGPSLASEMVMRNYGGANPSEGEPSAAWREIKRISEMEPD